MGPAAGTNHERMSGFNAPHCGSLRASDDGREVELFGWVARRGELDGVLADQAHGDLRVAAHEVFDQPGKQEVMGGAERSQ